MYPNIVSRCTGKVQQTAVERGDYPMFYLNKNDCVVLKSRLTENSKMFELFISFCKIDFSKVFFAKLDSEWCGLRSAGCSVRQDFKGRLLDFFPMMYHLLIVYCVKVNLQ